MYFTCSLRNMKKIFQPVLMGLMGIGMFFMVSITTVHAADVIVVATDTPNGWWFFEETPTGSGGFVVGPSTTSPPGGGSAQLTVNGTGGEIFGTFAFAGTRLDAITSLGYNTYRILGSSTLAPALQLDIDTNVTDSSTAWQGRLVYEPRFTYTVSTGVWQTWNPLDDAGTGNWWFTGAPGNVTCKLSNPCTWTELRAAFPNAGIRSAGTSTGALQFKVGGGWTSGFVGSVDAFNIGINNIMTSYDFGTPALVAATPSLPALGGALNANRTTITVVAQVNNDNGGTASYLDFPLFVNGNPVASGETKSLTSGVYTVTETNLPGYTINFTGDCDANGKINLAISGGSSISAFAVCTVINSDIGSPTEAPIPPLIDILKIPNPLALPDGPGPVTYTYTVTNIGIVPMTDISLLGDTCSPLVFVSGDTNNDLKLDVDEKWVYSCSTNLTETTKNTVVAIGHANGLTATHITNATVVVGAAVLPPLIHVIKIPSPLALPAGGGLVTYSILVTNPGVVALSNVGVKDDKCGAMVFVSGDTSSDSKLDPGETWKYTCQLNLSQTLINTVVASGFANDLVAADFALATVVVAAAPGFPNTGLVRDLKLGINGADVKALQQYLNTHGYVIAKSGSGSLGYETNYFGVLTQRALIKFQKDKGIKPAVGYFGPITRGLLSR